MKLRGALALQLTPYEVLVGSPLRALHQTMHDFNDLRMVNAQGAARLWHVPRVHYLDK